MKNVYKYSLFYNFYTHFILFDYYYLIYNKKDSLIMKNKHTKKVIPISIDKSLNDAMEELFSNKSRYVEWLIQQDLLKKFPDNEKLKNIIL